MANLAPSGEHADLLTALYQEYAAVLLGYLIKRLRPPLARQDAEDVTATVFAQAAGHLPLLASLVPNQRRAWLWRVGRNEMVDAWRHTQYKAHPRVSLDQPFAATRGGAVQDRGTEVSDIVPLADEDTANDPEGSALAGALLARIERCCVDAKDRLLLRARLAGLEAAEVAPLLGMTEHSAIMRLSRLRHRWLRAVAEFDPALLHCLHPGYRRWVEQDAPQQRAS